MIESLQSVLADEILLLEPYQVWIGAFICACVATTAFFKMIRWYSHARMMEIIPTSKVRSASQGYIELNGQARLMEGPLIISPLSRKSCVWYRYKIEEKVRERDMKGRSRQVWRVVKHETSTDLFFLEDETGHCVIAPDDADVLANNKRVWHKRTVKPHRRYTEELIVENEQLYAIGLFKSVANIERNKQNQQVAHLLREWKNDPNQLLHRFDSNSDGSLDQNEWEHARQAAIRHIKHKHGQKEKLEQLSVLSASSHKKQGFILSTVPESELIKKYKLHAFFALLSFLVVGSATVWFINIRLGL